MTEFCGGNTKIKGQSTKNLKICPRVDYRSNKRQCIEDPGSVRKVE